jgi:hypothetical protein
LVAWLLGCLVAWLLGCLVAWLLCIMAMEVRRKVDVEVEVETETDVDVEVEVETEASNTPPLLLVLPSPVGHAHSPCHSTPLVTVLPLSQGSPCRSAPFEDEGMQSLEAHISLVPLTPVTSRTLIGSVGPVISGAVGPVIIIRLSGLVTMVVSIVVGALAFILAFCLDKI